MKTKFIRFNDDWEYISTNNCFISAHIQLNRWLKENPNVKVINWHACTIGKDSLLSIIVEYSEEDNI